MRSWLSIAAVVALMAACSGDGATEGSVDSDTGAETPEAAVEQLFSLLQEGEFVDAASLAIPEQAALASLAEGAPTEEVAAALRDGDAVVAANFWSGFAQSVDDMLAQGVDVMGSTPATAEGVEFSIVEIDTGGGDLRQMTTREVDGYRIDIFATFGPALAARLYPQVEALLSDPTGDASIILTGLREQVASLYIASETPELAPNLVQDILQLIELITRVS